MKKMFVLFVFVLVLATGCSSDNTSESDGRWNHKEGFVVAKENGRVLVVRDRVDNIEAPLNEILEDASPNAIWLSVDKKGFDVVSVGDQVSINIHNGAIDQSYPAQASADVIKK
ncbi:hypothetical protein J23TS9_14470 [Paenibacillus sp. J23TS9]|nr:hypothetical protein J23TS9_14470 [Paenibacillus sp. J23TS9]